MIRKLTSIVVVAFGVFTASTAQAYTLQDYYEADAAVVTAQQAYDEATYNASPGAYAQANAEAEQTYRRGYDSCHRTGGSELSDCLIGVQDEYYAKIQEINQQMTEAQVTQAMAEAEFNQAQQHLSEVRYDLIAQGLLPH